VPYVYTRHPTKPFPDCRAIRAHTDKRILFRKFVAYQRCKLRRSPNRVAYGAAGQYVLLNEECSFSVLLLIMHRGTNVAWSLKQKRLTSALNKNNIMNCGKLSSDTFWAVWCSVNAFKIINNFSRCYSCLNDGHRTSRIVYESTSAEQQ
jgi:hypothetical protein